MKITKTITIWKIVLSVVLLNLVLSANAKQIYVEKSILGRVEEVLVFPEKLKFKAKLDTGAKTTSISAINIEEFEFDGKSWVSFKILNPRTQEFVKKRYLLERYARIKQHKNSNVRSARRPVVVLPLCLGKAIRTIEVNLVDRSHFKYPVLIGRDALVQFNGIIDPSKEYTISPECEDLQ